MIACDSLHYFVSSSQSLSAGIDFESTNSIIGALYAISSINQIHPVLKTSKIKTTDEQQAARPILAYSSLGSRLQGVGVNTHVDNELPQFVSDIVGKTFIFQLKGAQHDPDDWIPVQNPIASKVSAGTSSTVVEKTDGVAAELGENTNVNHQTFSSGVPGGRSASNNQIVDPKNGKKKARLD
ncbi:hypothetical protein Bca101_009740 [Brassica carinata]